MAFANRTGNPFKNAINSTPSIYQSIRCMSSSRLFIAGIPNSIDDHSLREAFTSYGEVVEARVIINRDRGMSRGFGFVTFTSSDEASAAISAMDGKELHGRVVRVDYANGGRNYGGGYYISGRHFPKLLAMMRSQAGSSGGEDDDYEPQGSSGDDYEPQGSSGDEDDDYEPEDLSGGEDDDYEPDGYANKHS